MTDTILITGAAKRLGLSLARHFLAKDMHVICTFRTMRDGIRELLDKGATVYQCDFYEQHSVDVLIHQLKMNHPTLRSIIHNASDWMDDANNDPAITIDKMLKVHVSAPYQINSALQSELKQGAAPYADIIHVTDYVATKGSKKHIAYAASKAALENMGLSFASAFAPAIKVNNIAPSLILFNEEDAADYKTKALNKALLTKEGGCDEFISAIDFVIKSTYITGQTIHLNGGRHLK